MSRASCRHGAAVALALIGAALVAPLSCIRPTPLEPKAQTGGSTAAPALVVWDGDGKGGNAKPWSNCNKKGACKSELTTAAGAGVDSSVGLRWHVEGSDWKGFGWNWFGWWPENAGTDLSDQSNLVFSIRLEFADRKLAPELKDIKIGLCSSPDGGKACSEDVPLGPYLEDLSDQKWHEVVIPIADLTKGKGKKFDPKLAWEFRIGEWSMTDRNYTIFVDNIGFDARKIVALISLPEQRQPAPVGGDVVTVTARIDLAAEGKPVSPFIYGVNFGDPEAMHEMGVTMRRQGGNATSAYDWKTGNSSGGADWFFENRKEIDTPHPQENWWVTMHRENKQYGMQSYFTMPMEWVAKDATSSGFPKSLYPECTEFAPDRDGAGNGKALVPGETGPDGKPKTRDLRCGKHPSQNGKHVGLEYNVELVKYCIEQAGFGKASQGGIGYICLDNEPMLYRGTHRDMICEGFTYDGYWERTKKYAELIRGVDPSVKIAAPGLWGWTAYSYGSADEDHRERNNLPWDKPEAFPDYGKYGPFSRDFMRRCAEYEKQTGRKLIDIFDFHGYPNTPKLDANMNEPNPSPEVQELRCRDVRKFWDESYRDPDTWMGKEGFANGNVAYVPLMRRWMKEAGWNAQIAIGEYAHAGFDGGKDVSSAVSQAESFAAFAIADVAYAMYWVAPLKHSPVYFAWKMFRNPDGKRTAVGDRFIMAEVSDFDSVSVYVFKDPARKVASFVILDKRAAKGAKVSISLGAPVPEQQVVFYEYSRANPKAIGALPPRSIAGDSIQMELPAMSIVRFDVQL